MGRLARLQRGIDLREVLPFTVSVVPLDTRTNTSPLTAAAATLMSALSPQPTVVVDADGTAQPLRHYLDSSGDGDLVGLAASHAAAVKRRSVEDFVDMRARLPLASCWTQGRGAVPEDTLRNAVWRLQRRFPNIVIDLPHGVPKGTLAVAITLSTHVILVGDRDDLGHRWLHEGTSVLSAPARAGAVTIAAVGADEAARDTCPHGDIVPVPHMLPGHAPHDRPQDTVGPAEMAGPAEIALRAVQLRA